MGCSCVVGALFQARRAFFFFSLTLDVEPREMIPIPHAWLRSAARGGVMYSKRAGYYLKYLMLFGVSWLYSPLLAGGVVL